jgi:hypothetical protein
VRLRTFAMPFVIALPLALAGSPAALAGTNLVQIDLADAEAVQGSYIVTVREGVDPRLVAVAATVSPKYVYTLALNGFAGQINDAQLALLQRHPDVVAIEQDQIASASTTYSTVHGTWDTWGLDRIDQRNLPLSNTFTVNGTASTVHAYVFDSGIRYSHVLFAPNRATPTYDVFNQGGVDCNGHGSHVSGIVGGLTGTTVTGVATGVQLHVVRVLDCAGNGPVSGIIDAINFVIGNHSNPAVANMSLGVNGISSSLDTATNNLIGAGVFTAIAAGNSNQNACNYSPARVAAALTVAASTSADRKASYSNKGSCVDLYAPGSAIWSAWYNGDGNIARIDGTSQATPHAAGVAALYLATDPGATPATTHAYLVNNATNGVISQNPVGTPNKLLYSNLL